MFASLATFVLSHRRVVLLGSLVAILGVTAGAASLRIDFSVLAFFSGDDPERVHFDAFRERWGTDDDVVMVVVHTDDDTLLTRSRLDAINIAAKALRGSDVVKSVFSFTDAPLPEKNAAVLNLAPFVERLPDDDDGFRTVIETIRSHPTLVPGLLSTDGRAAAMVVELTASSDDINAIQPTIREVRGVLSPFDGKAGVQYSLAGVPVVRSDFFEAFMRDQGVFIPLGMLLIFSLLTLLFRSVHGVVIPSIAAIVPVVMTFGVMGYLGEPIGIINQAFSILLPVIAVADAIHLVSRFHEEAGHLADENGILSTSNRDLAIVRAVTHIGGACALTTLTTAVGFASLVVARMPSMRMFGVFAAIGIVFAYGVVLVVVPLMLTLVRAPVRSSKTRVTTSVIDRALARCGDISVDRPGTVLTITALVVVVFGWASTHTTTDNHLTRMLKPAHPTTIANTLADEKLGGILAFEVTLEGDAGVMYAPKTLQAMASLESLVSTHDDVRSVFSLATIVKSVNESLTGDSGVPSTKDAVMQLLLLADSDGRARDLVSDDGKHARLQIRTRDIGGVAFTALAADLGPIVDEAFASSNVRAHLTGTPAVAYRGINGVTFDLRSSLLLAFLVIAFIIVLLLRSTVVALLCFLPNALPLVVGYGFLGMTGWLLEPSGAVIFTVALGIAVDDTLHLIVRTREELRAGHAPHDALKRSVRFSGRAVTVTSIILVGGFGVLALSSFPATTLLGALGAVIIFTALLCDVFVLPALLALASGSLAKMRATPSA